MKNLFLAILVFNFSICAEDQNTSINSLLDGLHQDAHEGNFKAYFARYSKNAVFLGTDKTAVSYTHLTLPTMDSV